MESVSIGCVKQQLIIIEERTLQDSDWLNLQSSVIFVHIVCSTFDFCWRNPFKNKSSLLMCTKIFSSGFKFIFLKSHLAVSLVCLSSYLLLAQFIGILLPPNLRPHFQCLMSTDTHGCISVSALLQMRHKNPILRLMFLKFILGCHEQNA